MSYDTPRVPGDEKVAKAGSRIRNRNGYGNGDASVNGYWLQPTSKQTRYNSSPETTPNSRQKYRRPKPELKLANSSFSLTDRSTNSKPNSNPINRVCTIKPGISNSNSERCSRIWPTAIPDNGSETLDQYYKLSLKHPPDGAGSPRVIQRIDVPGGMKTDRSIPKRSEHNLQNFKPGPRIADMEKAMSMSNLQLAPQHEVYPRVLETGANITDSGVWLTSDERDWQEMRRLRLENWEFRSQAHEMRMTLRKKQINKSSVEDRLFQLIRRKELGIAADANENGEETPNLTHLMEKNQEIRDEYGPLEDMCLELEDKLTEKESELTRLEQRFDKKWGRKPNKKVENNVDEFSQDESSNSESSSDEEAGKSFDHPLVTQFFLKKGELNLLRERIEDFWEEKVLLEDIKESHKRVNRSLALEDQAWLDDFPTSEAMLQKDIKALSDEIDLMRRDLQNRRLINDQDEAIDFQGREQIAFINDGLDVQDKVSEYVKYPNLLPKPGYKTELVYGKFDTDADCTTGYINHWLLDKLRGSPLEVNLLASTYEGETGKMTDTWETSVLSLWHDDGTNAGKIRVYTTSVATNAPMGSRQSTASRTSLGIIFSVHQ